MTSVPGVLELMSSLPRKAEVTGDGPHPAYVVIARDDYDRCGPANVVKVGAGADELGVQTPLREIARDRHRVRRELRDATP